MERDPWFKQMVVRSKSHWGFLGSLAEYPNAAWDSSVDRACDETIDVMEDLVDWMADCHIGSRIGGWDGS